jgi:hypothetical protein
VNILTDYSSKEQYKIQPEKNVVIDMRSIKKTKGERSTNLKIHDKEVPIVNTTTHLGIQRSSVDDLCIPKWVVVSLTVDDLCIPK